jgi:hypothetical protein
MKRRSRRQQGRSAGDLIEEAVHLLRTAPSGALAAYYLGSLPFMLGLLFFWADLSRNPLARQHVVEAALGVSALFLWMKFWQALFARRLRAHLAGETLPPLGFTRGLGILVSQAIVQPAGLFLLPLAAIPVLPLAWMYACFQNATALADNDVRQLLGKSLRQSLRWPGQNHLMLLYLTLFALVVFLNCIIGSLALPWLVKTLFGIETVFSRGGLAMLNTTFFAAMVGLTYLCVDPILKTLYVLRCFYGDSVQSGADLRADLSRFTPLLRARAGLAARLFLAVVFFVGAVETAAQPAGNRRADSHVRENPPASSERADKAVRAPAPQVSPTELDRAIGEVIQQRKYTWRLPREKITETDSGKKGILAEFFDRAGRMIRKWVRAFLEWLGEWLRKLFWRNRSNSSDGSGYGWMMTLQILMYVLLAAVLVAIGVLAYRLWRNRRRVEAVAAQPLQVVPDLTEENVSADQLPEDGWMKLAQELLARGEFRLALRAYYLASLAHLAGRNLISLARFKSNRDYQRELQRRAHSFPNLLQLFDENVSVFDRVWYGTHEAGGDLVSWFAENVTRLKAAG